LGRIISKSPLRERRKILQKIIAPSHGNAIKNTRFYALFEDLRHFFSDYYIMAVIASTIEGFTENRFGMGIRSIMETCFR
jgi:hypothetical protein